MPKKFVCFGEVLWDNLPSKKVLGGAPLNVANRLHSMGEEVLLISRIGQDEDGGDILNFMKESGMDTQGIQEDEQIATGLVEVELDEEGSAKYDIIYPSAWDKIAYTSDLEQKLAEADAMIFGSLVCRDEVSQNTLYKLIEKAQYKIFDINMRPPHFDYHQLEELMLKSDMLKLNDEELEDIMKHWGSSYSSIEQSIAELADRSGSNEILVTLGKDGAVFYRNGAYFHHRGFRVKTQDTVGAGDSFLAAFISKYFSGEYPQEALDYGCALGALVASRSGANPILSEEEVKAMMGGG